MNKTPLRRIALDSILNVRDLGGYLCEDGGVTQYGRFLRCGILQGPNEEDIEELDKIIPVRTVFDLRGTFEVEESSPTYRETPEVDYYHFPLLEINPAEENSSSRTLKDAYVDILENRQDSLRQIFTLMANAKEGAILYHCTLGKDRTGVLSALLLGLCGVDELDVIADYQVSETYAYPVASMMLKISLKHADEKTKENLISHMASPAENMRYVLRWLDENFDGAEGYLQKIGLEQAALDTVKARLTSVS